MCISREYIFSTGTCGVLWVKVLKQTDKEYSHLN